MGDEHHAIRGIRLFFFSPVATDSNIIGFSRLGLNPIKLAELDEFEKKYTDSVKLCMDSYNVGVMACSRCTGP